MLQRRQERDTNQTVLVMAVPADGAMTFAKMLYFLPSRARVRVRPMMAAFAVEYCANDVSGIFCRKPQHTDICLAKVTVFKTSASITIPRESRLTYSNLRAGCYNASKLLLMEYRPDGFCALASIRIPRCEQGRVYIPCMCRCQKIEMRTMTKRI